MKERRFKMPKFGNWVLLATGFAILAIVGALTNGTSKALAESDTFTTIDFPGASATFPSGINPGGDIVGDYDDSAGVSHGFLLREDSFTTFDFPGLASPLPTGSTLAAISWDGMMTVPV